MKLKLIAAIFCINICSVMHLTAQDFMLQGWYWDYPKTSQGAFWVDTLNLKAKELSNAGFTMIWTPPMSMAASGNSSNGYDIKDLFNVGGPGLGNTGFGNKPKIQNMIAAFNQYNIKAIGDMVYNHRDGGILETNTAVGGWIKNYNLSKHNNGDIAYPSDRFACILTLGGTTGRGAGTYYFRIRSASLSTDYYNKPYKFYVRTQRIGSNPVTTINETSNNGGSLCSQASDSIGLAQNVAATIDNGGCGIDEFKIVLDTSMFYSTGDRFYITMVNDNGDYSDHYIYSLYYDAIGAELKDSVQYQTRTNFSLMQSGRGQMNYGCFKPNGNPTCLCGDWDQMLFFYDYDQAVTSTRDTLFEWTRWMWDSIGVRGFRADAVKNYSYQFNGQLLDNLYNNGKTPSMFVGEYYDYNPASLKSWVDNVINSMAPATQAAVTPRLFDFALQGSLKEACDNISNYDTRGIFQSGMVDGAGANGYNAVTFVNNHDFRFASQSCDIDRELAYAYILTNNAIGLPCVYYPDYYDSSGTAKTKIDELIDLHKKFVYQTSFREYLNRFSTPFSNNYISGSADKCLIYQLSGGGSFSCIPNRDVIVAINFGNTTLKVDQQVNTGAPFHSSAGDTLLDVLGNSGFPYAIVNGGGQMYIELPPRSYSAWVKLPQIATPVISLQGNGANFCKGDSVLLVGAAGSTCYQFNWKRNGITLPFEKGNTLVVKESGTYTVTVSYFGNFAQTSAPVVITVSPVQPVVTANVDTLSSTPATTYQWFYSIDSINYTLLTGATAQTLVTQTAGWYYVLITDVNGCTDTSIPYHLTFTGTDDILGEFSFNVSPNPVQDVLNVRLISKIPADYHYEIINPLGQKVMEYNYRQLSSVFEVNVKLNSIPTGVYFLKVSNGKNFIVKSFIKQ